jgi:SAM-dependent methyltransferase
MTFNSMENHIKPITMPGIHKRFYEYVQPLIRDKQAKILEVGAGHGAFTKLLYNDGFSVSACDLFPGLFYLKEVECLQADVTKELPYAPDTFDVVLAVEVMEHIHDHQVFFKEAARVLKKNGMLIFSTPNILSLKSRIRFLFSGFFYAFKPLAHGQNDGLQHLSSLTADQYENLALNSGFQKLEISIDKRQSTSRLLFFIVPFIWIYCKLKGIDYKIHNKNMLLLGRILFVTARKAI